MARLGTLLLALGSLHCAAGVALRTPGPEDLASLDALRSDARQDVPFTATGRARLRTADEEIDGGLEARIAPPAQAWLEVRTRAVFGMVGERVVASLPGDGWVLVYEERADALRRVAFDSSLAADLTPTPEPAALLALLRGRIPDRLGRGEWDSVQVAGSGNGGRLQFWVRRGARAGGKGEIYLEVEAPNRLRRFQWREAGGLRLDVQYDRYQSCGSAEIPTRLRLRAPQARLEAEVELEHLEPREGFGPSDFEVGANPPAVRTGNPARG